jgi:hypothetical protein
MPQTINTFMILSNGKLRRNSEGSKHYFINGRREVPESD